MFFLFFPTVLPLDFSAGGQEESAKPQSTNVTINKRGK